MKRSLIAICAATALFCSCNNAGDNKNTSTDTAATATTADAGKEEPFTPVDSATRMKAWMAYATPGEPHKMLAKADGKWTAEVTHWEDSDKPPMTSTGECTNRMIMGGHYQQSDYKGNMMGMPFEGMGIVGYDNAKKKFISTWFDNMGTGIMTMEGDWDQGSNTINYSGTGVDPVTGKDCKIRETFTMVDNDHQTMAMYGPDNKTGKEYKMMEIKFTRVK